VATIPPYLRAPYSIKDSSSTADSLIRSVAAAEIWRQNLGLASQVLGETHQAAERAGPGVLRWL
jgi:hypothetical protein